ncbi:MAG: DUF190 domain-containing protein [Candidatus Marinimicrobia bacterium]|nr:DUF190 domain-containing protein [Candidatus Neomarinimicrobiota bacterium]
MLEYYEGQKLSIFISKNDKYEGIVLYELLLEIAFNSRLSGGTVTIGDKGFFGDQDESTKLKVLRSAENLPVVLEFQGRTDRIVRYIERVQPMIKEGLFTVADVQIIKFNSPHEETNTLEDKKNQDQSKIFDQDNDVSRSPEPLQANADATPEAVEPDSFISDTESPVDENRDDVESASFTPETEVPADEKSESEMDESLNSEFLEPDENQEADEAIGEDPDPGIDVPPMDEEPLGPNIDEDSLVEAEEDDPDIPGFQSLDDDELKDDPDKEDTLEDESDELEEEVLQLADFSETQDEEEDDDTLEMDDPDETAEDTSDESEFAEPKTEDELDALFEETSEKFESTFDDMLKQVSGASAEGPELEPEEEKTVDKEPEVESPGPGTDVGDDDSGAAKSETGDKNHNEEEMKNYFSSLFKK